MTTNILADSFLTIEKIYKKLNYSYTTPQPENESKEYDACTFKLNGLKVIFRSARITPTKVGQFVTIWRRNQEGVTQPHEITDPFDLIIISVLKDEKAGHFIFPKSVLAEQGVISTPGKEGKRGIRVYPPWDITINKQAQKTQKWQLNYFVNLNRLDLYQEKIDCLNTKVK